MFDQFVNRTIAYGYNNHLGLITFSSTATIARQLTDVVEDFRATVNQLTPNSDTALWDGLALARHQIEQYSTKFPQAKKRILCISDGEDTKSSRDVIDVCDDLVQSGIVVDSFSLGNEDHDNLLTISHLTGGYKFVPKTLSQAMQIVELEPVLSLKDRDDVVPPPAPRGSTRYSRFNLAMAIVVPEIMTEDVFPKRRAHPNINDDVIELAAAKRMASSNRTESNMLRNSRLLTEIQNIIANPHPHYDVFVSERDISFWKVVMTGPPESPYASGTFLFYLHMDEQSKWPTFAPTGRFCTPIHHPNVNSNGRICHSIFDRNWTSDTSCSSILNSIYGLLLVPDYSDPV
jgi:ubiquitin-protein ligase